MSLLAPLHNPAAIVGIKAAQSVIKNAKHVTVFDTAFHQTMPEENYLYALPYELYDKYGVIQNLLYSSNKPKHNKSK